ncbi:MAG: leucyl aminopeptidase [Thermoplasmata archaeon]|nr:MAG: leucyl aminopeptidase [Thermoplasmata archaeon]
MKIAVNMLQPEKLKTKTIIMGVLNNFENLNKSEIPPGFEKQLEILLDSKNSDFKGKLNEIMVLYSSMGIKTKHPYRLILVGLGDPQDLFLESIREGCGTAGNLCNDKNIDSIGIIIPAGRITRLPRKEELFLVSSAVVEGLILGAYRFNKYKSGKDKSDFKFENIIVYARSGSDIPSMRKGINYADVSSEITAVARDLSNTPSNDLTPGELVKRARSIARKYGLKIKVITGDSLEQNQMSGIIAVGKGSSNPPSMIILEYVPKRARNPKPVVFVGKAVTFDSGGISLKPGANMALMKHDMSGGAAVIASLAGLAKLGAPVHAVGLIPAVENLPSGTATRPGDVITSKTGKSIEILNTDAEGRLILADALAYANRYEPGIVVDVATLTGACVVALGTHTAGLMGNNEKLLDAIVKLSEQTGERVWKLPLWKPYRNEMTGDTADIKNVSGREGGAITAAAFLLEFAEKYKWAHIDIAGMAWTEKPAPYKPKGATGFSARLLMALGNNIGEQKLKL